ncbi:MAG: hypothetical protein HRT89_03925 [Lentisphaeria bacterium]|nr:hypothetical protein [Lentisphaeria bacterium]NQZ67198.1 hypothetical protein [Lentisphaeria bacterium]
MSYTDDLVHSYLTPPVDYFWRWDPEESSVITWQDSTTIVYKKELCEHLKILMPEGLPPLASVILLLAACRENFEAMYDKHIPEKIPTRWSTEMRELLDKVRGLPEEIRTDASARRILLSLVFEDASRGLAESARIIVNTLESGIEDFNLYPDPAKFWTTEDFISAMHALSQGLAHRTTEGLEQEIRSGTNSIPVTYEIEAPENHTDYKQLITKLAEDHRLKEISLIAKNLSGVLSLPRPVSMQDDLPVGGVSDISNRGPLHRLLLSELANDDLVLLVKIALNEALYLRRETMPKADPETKDVYIDSSIRMWGIPRLFAVSLALSIAATLKKEDEINFHRIYAKGTARQDLDSTENIFKYLENLEISESPFMNEIEFDAEHELHLICHEDALADACFKHFQAKLQNNLFIYALNRYGDMTIYIYSKIGRHKLKSIALDFGSIFTTEKSENLPAKVNLKHPLYLRIHPSPLRMPFESDITRSAFSQNYGLVCIDRYGHFKHEDNQGGFKDYGAGYNGKLIYIGINRAGVASVVFSTHDTRSFLYTRIDLNQGLRKEQELVFSLKKFVEICIYKETLFIIHKQSITAYNAENAEYLDSINLRIHMRHRYNRYFQDDSKWYALVMDEGRIRFNQIHEEHEFNCLGIYQNSTGTSFAVNYECNVLDLNSNKIMEFSRVLEHPNSIVAVSDDEKRILLKGFGGEVINMNFTYAVLDMETEKAQVYGTMKEALFGLNPDCKKIGFGDHFNLSKYFKSLYISETKCLGLISKNNNCFELNLIEETYDNKAYLVFNQVDYINLSKHKCVPFQNYKNKEAVDIISKADISDDCIAWIDRRGLLHITAASLPEICISLSNSSAGNVAVWTSQNELAGHSYFTAITDKNSTHIYNTRIKELVAFIDERI